MTEAQEIRFQGLAALWTSQMDSAKFHMDTAVDIVAKSMPVNDQLYAMEQKHGINRKDVVPQLPSKD